MDEINIVCYNSDLHPSITDQVSKVISEFDNVKIVKDIFHHNFDWEMVTANQNLCVRNCVLNIVEHLVPLEYVFVTEATAADALVMVVPVKAACGAGLEVT